MWMVVFSFGVYGEGTVKEQRLTKRIKWVRFVARTVGS